MEKHCLFQWKFKFDNAASRMGYCSYRTKTISLSKHLTVLNAEHHLRNTILHEIAHAMAPKGSHHGHKWRKIALLIGCDGKRCYDETVLTPQAKFKGTCPTCSHTYLKHRRADWSCHLCSPGVYNTKHLIVWERQA